LDRYKRAKLAYVTSAELNGSATVGTSLLQKPFPFPFRGLTQCEVTGLQCTPLRVLMGFETAATNAVKQSSHDLG